MKGILYSTIVISIFLIASCTSLNKTTSSNTILFKLETTACYGTCPVYTLEIFSDGETKLTGKQHIDKIGAYKAYLNEERLNSIIESFNQASFFEFKDSYRSLYKDLPTKYISYNKDDKTKTVMAYDNIPKELTKLIEILEKLVEELEWEKAD